MAILTSIADEALRQGTLVIVVVLVLSLPLLRRLPNAVDLRPRVRFVSLLVAFHVVMLVATGIVSWLGAGLAKDLRLLGSVAGALAGASLAGLIVFSAFLPRLRIAIPRIVQDVLVAAISLVAVFGTAARAGMDLSGIVATGAVVTAVIGLALQDTLGNVVGGLALQLDNTIRVGDWIKLPDVMGKVVEIRWRSTSIETPDWETVILPNSLLTKSQVMVLGRRSGEAPRWRSSVTFGVDFRYPPTQVIEAVMATLQRHPIDNVADNPPLECILVELGESFARYAVRFWLLDPGRDATTDGLARTRIYFALTRAGIPLSLPAHAVFLTEDSVERKQSKHDAERQRRISALAEMELFRELSDGERAELASSLQRAPFAKGEVMTREGAEAHHLYLITKGRASVRTRQGSVDHEVAQLEPGKSFGEMSLLTGAPRAATIVALTEMECYRLDAQAFRKLLERRSDLAARMAAQLAERQVALVTSREQLADHQSLVQEKERALLDKIRSYFQL